MDSLLPKPSCFIFGASKSHSYKMDNISIDNKDVLPTHIIIDCSMLSYIDTTGVTTLKELVQKHGEINIVVLLAGCPVHIESMLRRDGFFHEVSIDRVYKSVHDAVTYILEGFTNIYMPGMNGTNLKPNQHFPQLLSTTTLDLYQNQFNSEQNNILNNERNQQKNDLVNGKPEIIAALKRKAPHSPSQDDNLSSDSSSLSNF